MLIATIISGNSESIIADAIRTSEAYVDRFILIDTGISDRTIEIAKELLGTRLSVEPFAWINDFAAVRNFALKVAERAGASWAMTVDTDERFLFPPEINKESLQALLNSRPEVLTWMVHDRNLSYAKERFFRMPSPLRWTGRTHECIVDFTHEQRKVLEQFQFFEVAKSSDQFRHKLTRDEMILRREVAEHPTDGRWWYYLGQTLEDLGKTHEAIDAYSNCCLHSRWHEQISWAHYCMARCLVRLELYEDALGCCTKGLFIMANSTDLLWMASWCCYQLRRYHDAVAWARMCAALGNVCGSDVDTQRLMVRHVPALFESPFDVLRHAYRELGKETERLEAEAMFEKALALRHTQSSLPAVATTPA